MIKVDGFKAFRGTMEIRPGKFPAFRIVGDWLYKPDADCWYTNGASYPSSICFVLEVE